MKIRIGVGGAAGASSTPGVLAELVTAIDEPGFDSPEREALSAAVGDLQT